ncbi:MAG TPA: hypothetical protein VNS79_12885 [Sphingobium sp.]|nr:hypothetical protein [Sphingobium sp.]
MASQSKLAGGLAAVALLLVSASPADARGYGRWHPRHHDRVDAGAVFGVLLGVGILAAVASAAQNKGTVRRDDERRYDPRYDDPRYDDPRADNGGYPRDDRRDYGGRAPDGRDDGDGYGDDYGVSYADEGAAVDACAIAARDEASRAGEFAEVRDITDTQPYGSGWDVTGTIDQRAGWRASDSRLRSFRCIWDAGRVSGVTFG